MDWLENCSRVSWYSEIDTLPELSLSNIWKALLAKKDCEALKNDTISKIYKLTRCIYIKGEYFFGRNNFFKLFKCHFPALVLNQMTEILFDTVPINCTQFTTSSWNCYGCNILHCIIDRHITSRVIRVQQMIQFFNYLFLSTLSKWLSFQLINFFTIVLVFVRYLKVNISLHCYIYTPLALMIWTKMSTSKLFSPAITYANVSNRSMNSRTCPGFSDLEEIIHVRMYSI